MKTNPFGQLVSALSQQGLQGLARTRHYNPRPKGVMQPGGATVAVLSFLKESPDRYFTFDQLIMATNHSNKAVDWACLRLRNWGFVVTRPDPYHPRYLQYKYLHDGGQL